MLEKKDNHKKMKISRCMKYLKCTKKYFLFFSGFKSTLHAEGLNPLHKQLPKWPTSSYLFSEHLTFEFFVVDNIAPMKHSINTRNS